MKIYEYSKIPETIDGLDVIQNEQIALEMLKSKQSLVRYEFGDSLSPIIQSGQFCKLSPIENTEEIQVGDIVTSLVNGAFNTHMVGLISHIENKTWYCIVTTQGNIVGWTNDIVAKATPIDHIVRQPRSSMLKKKVSSAVYTPAEIFVDNSISFGDPYITYGNVDAAVSREELLEREELLDTSIMDELMGNEDEEHA